MPIIVRRSAKTGSNACHKEASMWQYHIMANCGIVFSACFMMPLKMNEYLMEVKYKKCVELWVISASLMLCR